MNYNDYELQDLTVNTNEESITYENGVLTLPGYSIAVFTLG